MNSDAPVSTSTAAQRIELNGLEADNLLAFLALLGLLRAIETARPEWRPRVAWSGTPIIPELIIDTRVSEKDVVAEVDAGILSQAAWYDFDRADITYTPAEFRSLAMQADGHERAALVAALASDGAKRRDGKVEPTALCAMFGQGHQHFLSRLSSVVTRAQRTNLVDLERALFEPWQYNDDTDSFRWDPGEDRRYAHQFGDPSEGRNKIGTVTGANRLAAVGFSVLTSAPTTSGLATLGISGTRRERNVCWPIVSAPTSLSGHRSLLAHPYIGAPKDAPALKAYGVAAIARARRYQSGKFFNFERARVQLL